MFLYCYTDHPLFATQRRWCDNIQPQYLTGFNNTMSNTVNNSFYSCHSNSMASFFTSSHMDKSQPSFNISRRAITGGNKRQSNINFSNKVSNVLYFTNLPQKLICLFEQIISTSVV